MGAKIEVFEGDAYPLLLTFRQGSTAWNLTGKTISLVVKDNADATSNMASYSVALTDPTNGLGTATLTTASTGTAGQFFYKIIETTGGITKTLQAGPFVVVNT